jgi:hypothetical protein
VLGRISPPARGTLTLPEALEKAPRSVRFGG